MKKCLVFIISVCFFSKITNAQLTFKRETDSAISKIIIINSFDAQLMKARKSKKELFAALADSLKQMLNFELNGRDKTEVIIIPDVIKNPENNDSIYFNLINAYHASKAIVIKTLDAYFEQTGVEVVKEADGKKRTASYNICSSAKYFLYNRTSKVKESETKLCKFFTERNVLSGFLAAGPDIVGKSKYAFKIIQDNAKEYNKEISYYLRND